MNRTGTPIRSGDRSDFPRRPGIVRQLEAVIDGLDVAQARVALKAVVAFCAGDDTGAGEALFHGLAVALGAPWDEGGYGNWRRTRAAVEGRA